MDVRKFLRLLPYYPTNDQTNGQDDMDAKDGNGYPTRRQEAPQDYPPLPESEGPKLADQPRIPLRGAGQSGQPTGNDGEGRSKDVQPVRQDTANDDNDDETSSSSSSGSEDEEDSEMQVGEIETNFHENSDKVAPPP